MNNDENIETKHWNNFYIDIDFRIERRFCNAIRCSFSLAGNFQRSIIPFRTGEVFGVYGVDVIPALYFTPLDRIDIRKFQCYVQVAMQKNSADAFFRIVADFLFSSIILSIVCVDISWIQIFYCMLKYKLFNESLSQVGYNPDDTIAVILNFSE